MMEVISTRRYEARPPPTSTHPPVLIDPENSVALVKEEEWETRKKKEITTTRQIETRVKRQVVLEDGEVVVDSGPLVTTNTTEDVEQQEHTTQERRTTGEDPQEVEWPANGKGKGPVEAGSVVQKELNETVVRSREEIEERLETEDRHQLGDISDEVYQSAVRKNRGDLRLALAESQKQLLSTQQAGPRVIQHTTRSNKVIDTEKTLERKELKADGLIVTERKCTVEHEEIKDDELPDDGKYVEGEESEDVERRKESSQRFVKKRDEDVVDYVLGGERVGREMRYVAETTEGERIGDWSPSPTAMRTSRLHKHAGLPADSSAAARKDALTRKPLDFEEEDEARKFETSKWLESHFGSESRSSHGSIEADDSPVPTATNTSYINVTMRSIPPKERDYQNVNSSRHKQRTDRTSTSPSGYFHGISEWSERYQGREKQKNHMRPSSPSPSPSQLQLVDTQYTNGHSHRNQVESTYSRTYESLHRREHQEPVQERARTPSPPVRRRVREQWARSEEKTMEPTPVRTSSPVHVLQQTWESRSRDVQRGTLERSNRKKSISVSRSPSPSPRPEPNSRDNKKSNDTSNTRPHKSPGHSKYKIGESFRKLVDKLRSASTERKNKRANSSSASQLTQTDDNGPTYLQYNVIDKNIPLVNERDEVVDEKPPERPPRSPRHPSAANKSGKSVKSNEYVVQMQEQCQRSVSTPPLQRYYLGEDPFGGSIYGREKGYREREARRASRPRGGSRVSGETEYSAASSSLGRFSKSTSRLASDYEREEYFRSTQTLPRNLHSSGHGRNTRPSHSHHTALRRQHQLQQAAHSVKHGNGQQISIGPSGGGPSRQYGSMINISIKNTVIATKSTQNNLQPPPKPERTYKSSLARSKSFNVEAEDRNNSDTPPRIPYTSNLQLNRLGETTPLKSPGILASLSRSNRDLFKNQTDH